MTSSVYTGKMCRPKSLLMVTFIVLLAGITRFYQLGQWPTAFAADEAALGYNAWSLLTTARDEWGKLFPLTMRSFDDWKPAIYSYLAIPGVKFFGLNEFSSRLPAAIFGVLLPFWLYLMVKQLSKNGQIGLLAALMVILSPWHLEISRTAVEAGVALSLFIFSLVFWTKKQKKYHWWGFLLLLLTLFTYHTARIVAPLVILTAFWTGTLQVEKRFKWLVGAIFAVGIILSLTASSSRFAQISIFHDLGAQLHREEAIREDGGVVTTSNIESRAFHNKPVSWFYGFAESYLTNISFSYLFLGGAQPPRVTIPETGQFLIIYLPFLLLGLATSLRRWKEFDRWLVIWFFLAPLPAALTYAELPHAYRTLFLLPPLAIFIAQGIVICYQWLKSLGKMYLTLGLLIFIVSSGYFFARAVHQYRVHQQVHQPWYRQSGYEELISYLNSLSEASRFIITNREGEPYIFVLFYNKISPLEFQAFPEKRLSHQAIERGSEQWQMFNYTFSEQPCPIDVTDKDPTHVYVTLPECELPASFERLKTIDFLDGRAEFLVSRPASSRL